jgi:hypothetical protein
MEKSISKLVFVFTLILLGFSGLSQQVLAQTPPADPGVTWIMVTFDQIPTTYSVIKTPLRYNKTFAVSFHNDDGIADIYTEGFPFFTGIPVGSTAYPGLFYTDGCGNDISFKLSSNLFSFNGISGPDMHTPGNGYGVVSWPQLDIMYQNDCGIYSHGINSDAFSDLDFINYSIKRNESYIRRKLFETTPGGVQTRLFVNPNGNGAYSQPAFDLGYIGALNQISQSVIGNNGGDVNNYDNWLVPANLNRLIAEATNVTQLADDMFANSINGANYWAPLFTHSIVSQYPLADFHTDFNYIASTYGRDGLDNVWVATEEEIISYLRVKEATNITYGLAGNILLITLSGSIPSDMRFYPLSLLIDADANITNIQFSGGTNTFNGIGQTSSLINLEWDGRFIPDVVVLADSMVTIAEQTQTQYDCWIAMDYVYMVSPGPERTALRDRLCDIENVTYDAGFCETCTFNLGADSIICQNDCIELSAPFAEGSTYIWSNDSTTQTITVCPADTTIYWVELTTIGGCIASDTIQINTLPLPIFNLGPDSTICLNDCILLTAPLEEGFTYLWSNDSTTQSITVCPSDTTDYWVELTNINGCSTTDTIQINTLALPVFDLGPDQNICLNDTAHFNGPVDQNYTYSWFADNVLLGESSSQLSIIVTDTTLIRLDIEAPDGCMASDSASILAWELPSIQITPSFSTLCLGESVTLTVSTQNAISFEWLDGSTEPTLVFEPDQPGTYQIWAMAENGFGCTKKATAVVIVYDNPGFQLSVSDGNDTICINDELTLKVNFLNSIPIEYLIWNETDTIKNVTNTNYYKTISPLTSGWFPVKIISVNNCYDNDSIYIRVVPLPVMTITNDSVICSGETISIEATGGQSCVWYIGNEVVSETYSLDVAPLLTTTYVAEITGNDAISCISTDSVTITVHPKPVVSVSFADTTVCAGSSLTLQASGALNYLWSDLQTKDTIDVTINESILYSVVGSTEFGCSDTAVVQVNVFPQTEVSFTGLLPVYCLNDLPSQLVGTPEGGLFTGPGMVAGKFNPAVAEDGVHLISYTYTDENNCSSIYSMETSVFGGSTQIDIGPDSTICPNDFLLLNAGEGFSEYYWSNGQTTQTVIISGLDYAAGSIRDISVVGVLDGCTASGKMTLTIRNDCFIDINEKTNGNGLTILPNPNDGNFKLSFPETADPQKLIISTANGIIVYEQSYNSNSVVDSEINFRLPSRLHGVFIISLQTKSAVYTSKLVIR